MKVFRNYFLVFVLALGLSLTPAAVKATPILDFGIVAPTTGSISYAGNANPLVGTDIQVDNVVGLSTPLNQGVLRTIISGALDFTTGGFTGNSGLVSNFGAGGSIKVIGGVDLNNNGDANDAVDIPVGTTLLTGSWTSPVTVVNIGDVSKIFGAAFIDTKNKELTDYYGLPDGVTLYIGSINLSFEVPGGATPPNGFTTNSVQSGDIKNSPIPEPATMLLLGSGLLGIGIIVRRKFKK